MAELKGLALGLQGIDQGEREGSLVPPNTPASGNRKAHAAKPKGTRVPPVTSKDGDLKVGPVFSSSDPTSKTARRR